MKRFITMLIVGLVISTISMAQELNDEQLTLRTDLVNFLKVEGFMPEIDTDGEIKFKSEGTMYYIKVSPTDKDPMYVTIIRRFGYPENYSPETLVMATKELNMYKGVKVLCFEESFQVRAELYVRNSEAVKSVLYKLLNNISNAVSDVLDECAKVGSVAGGHVNEIPFLVTKLEVANTDKDGNIIQDYGATIYDFKTQYLKPKITVKPIKSAGTYEVYVKLYKDGSLRTGNSSPKGYSYSNKITLSDNSSQVLYLSGWGSTTSGHWSAGEYRFEIWYGDYCIGSKTFKVI